MILRKRSDLLRWLPELSCGRSVILTNGCFDPLHYGHIKHLQNQMRVGNDDYFRIVALNSDYSILQYKQHLPLIEEMDRAVALDELDCVDLVYIFNDPTPREVIKDIDPDIYFKGGDYNTPQDLPEYELCKSLGAEVIIDPTEGSMRSSDIKRKMKNE